MQDGRAAPSGKMELQDMKTGWSGELETGNAVIDEQHRRLLEVADEMLKAYREGRGPAKVAETMAFLEEYVARHFADEERLQVDAGYPDYKAHKAEHDEFLATFKGLKIELEKVGPTESFMDIMNRTIVTWLVHHIKRTDKALSEFVQKSEGSS